MRGSAAALPPVETTRKSASRTLNALPPTAFFLCASHCLRVRATDLYRPYLFLFLPMRPSTIQPRSTLTPTLRALDRSPSSILENAMESPGSPEVQIDRATLI